MPYALVTGAGVRVGRAIACALAAEGYTLLLHANSSRAAVDEVRAGIEARGGAASVHLHDLSSPAGTDALAREAAEATDTLDVLVNSAALFGKVPFREVSREDYARLQAVNLEAPFFLTQRLLPLLEAAAPSLVVNIGDVMGQRSGPGYAHYAVTKAALLHLTRALAVELAPKVRVCSVSPGTVDFPVDYDEELRGRIRRRIPLGHEGEAADIARAVVFLAKHAPFVSGQDLQVDGGRSQVP
jgi:pteridine reductase